MTIVYRQNLSLLLLALLIAAGAPLWAQTSAAAKADPKATAAVPPDPQTAPAAKAGAPEALKVKAKEAPKAKPPAKERVLAEAPAVEPAPRPAQASRTVKVGPKDVTTLHCSVRFETLVVLPAGEKILEISTGDKDFWAMAGIENFCHIKPAQPGLTSNLHLITASGNVYSFLLRETSKDPHAGIDHKVFLEPSEAMPALSQVKPRFVGIEQLDAYKNKMETELHKLQAHQNGMLGEVSRFKAEYPTQLVFDYEFRAPKVIPVSAVYHDDKFTYIKCTAKEKPALYEVKEGQPNLVNFQLQGDTYIVDKVLDEGYLQVGKTKMPFKRKTS